MLYQRYFKRIIDLLFSIAVLVVFCWLYMIIAIAILVTDGRPILFKQERIGRYGKPFWIYKFRTMVKNAEKIGARSTANNDPRITPIGRFLRKTSLDELAQIFNVIKGDMSIIGYRPGVRENYTEEDFKSELFEVKPGITGYAQVNGRSSLEVKETREWEKKYVQEISFGTDLKIFSKTILVVLKRSGTN